MPRWYLTESERFWQKVDKTDTCWLWNASLDRKGYGQFRVGALMVRAHSFAYQQIVGPIPYGLELDHLCRVTRCVNPAHLEPVTHGENMRRWMASIGNPNARKTHCPKGHPYDALNVKGGRRCRQCEADSSRRYSERRRLASRLDTTQP